jgi:hypothetical protein
VILDELAQVALAVSFHVIDGFRGGFLVDALGEFRVQQKFPKAFDQYPFSERGSS